MPQRNQSSSGSDSIAILRKRSGKIAIGLRPQSPLTGVIRPKDASARPLLALLSSGTNTFRPTSKNSNRQFGDPARSFVGLLFRACACLIVVLVLVAVSVTIANAQAGSTNAPTSILDEYKNLEGQWISKLLGAAQRLFVLLAGIEVVWSFTLLALEKADFQLLTAAIIRSEPMAMMRSTLSSGTGTSPKAPSA